MPTVKVRALGSGGIISDVYPVDLESTSVFTAGVNVRFKNGRVSRGPVCRRVNVLPHEPGHVLSIPPGASGTDEIVSISHDFASIYRLNGSTWEDLSVPGQVGTSGTQSITSCFLGGVSYINRETHLPASKLPGGGTYTDMPNWPSDVRCKVLRAYKDQLVALGVTKGGAYYPTMVKWSDFATFAAPPASWDPTSTTNSAGENIVNEMQQEIVDGLALGDAFMIYCAGSVWRMTYTGGDDIYDFRKAFDGTGVIAPNCVVQVGGLHYVFDRDDIYVHDGVAPRSIADAKVKDFVFGGLDFSGINLCHVTHERRLTEVRFWYPSSDRLIGFPQTSTGCNRCAAFNYSDGTWTFYDAPNVTGGTRAAIIGGDTWETDPDVEFDQAAGKWNTVFGDEDRHTLVVTRPIPGLLETPRLYGFDLISSGRLPVPIDLETVRPAFVERIGIDMDAQGKFLTQYVQLQAVYPQMAADRPEDCTWQFGANDLVNQEPLWSPELPFDPAVDTKIDTNEPGKYLGYRFWCRGSGDFTLSGFDALLVIRGRR